MKIVKIVKLGTFVSCFLLSESLVIMGPLSAAAKRQAAMELMNRFASRTGLLKSYDDSLSRRYLWTDAFAVCNFLGFAATEDQRRNGYEVLALDTVTSVHGSLGRFRADDLERCGKWLSGLPEEEGKKHPTAGGLRIGKKLRERSISDPVDSNTEWDRDGQYFHYLTKWAGALHQMSQYFDDSRYNAWAAELLSVAADKFIFASGVGQKRMYWKMTIDLERPQVSSMGAHDPLDGYVTLSKIMSKFTVPNEDLEKKRMTFRSMIHNISTTDDPLGLGGMLVAAFELHQLQSDDRFDKELIDSLLEASLKGLDYCDRSGLFDLPAASRLAFRELGLSIGLHAIERMDSNVHSAVKGLKDYASLADRIEEFWLNPKHQGTARWKEHMDINEVMLATSLDPEGFLK